MHDAGPNLQIFTLRQKGQLDVYGVWGVWRGQLHSDDSFDFNKAVSRIKDSISHLPSATEHDDALLEGVQVRISLATWPALINCLWQHTWATDCRSTVHANMSQIF